MTYIRKVIGVIPPCPCPNGEGSESSAEHVSEAVAQATHSLQRELTNLGESNKKFGSKLKRKVIGKTYDGPKGSNTPPKMDADTPVVGKENAFARGDHQHPRDTTKADVTALETERNRAMDAETALGNRITTNSNAINAEKQRAQEAEQQLRALYQALTETETIPVSELPATGEANKIYRVAGDGNYSDYMWNGTEWVLMATYDNDIDDEPTPGSKNLVESGGVAGMYGYYIDNPEFLYVMTDIKQRILLALRKDGQVMFGAGVPYQVKEYVDAKIAEILGDDDLTEKIDSLKEIVAFLENFKNSDKLKQLLDAKVDKEEGKSLINKDYADGITYIENPEFVEVKLDAEGRVLWGIRADGTIVCGAGIPTPVQEAINALYRYIDKKSSSFDEIFKVVSNPEYVFAIVDAEDKFLCGITVEGEWKTWKSDTPVDPDDPSWIEDWFEEFNDPEGRSEMTLDAERKILGYRDKDGVRHENYLAVDKNLKLSGEAMTDFQQALKEGGFTPGGGGDWTDREVIELPEPKHYALLNIDVDYLPLNDGDKRQAEIQYYDGLGNSFKIDAEIEPQGQTSRIFARTGGKGNYTLDLSKDVKFGSWVPQDSFHLKGAAKDVVRGILPTSYKWAYMMQGFLDAKPNRVLIDESGITETAATGKRINDWPADARCLPDGFPVELYVNGEYHGLYAIQLKKHRKNYSMDKKDYTSLFIDADWIMTDDYQHGIWNDGPDATNPNAGNRKWWEGFDIKGPKDLICMDGSEFDGDAPKELIDETSPVYDASNKKHKGSAQAKAIIRGFQTKYLEVKTLIDNNDTEAAKVKFNENFDYNACMLVFIYNCLMKNADSVKKNTLWGTYKNGKIFPSLWDLDGMYGQGWVGDSAGNPSSDLWNGAYATAEWPLKLFKSLYDVEIKAAYSSLRDSKVISLETWYDIVFNQWVNRIGEEAYNRDIKKWPETPSYRENYTDTEHWQQLGWTSSPGSTPVWEEGNTYNEGTIVVIKSHPMASGYVVWMRYKALVTTDTCPVTKFYTEFPIVGGFYDSPKRWKKWIDNQIILCDVQNDYNLEDILADFIAYRVTDTEYEIACSNMSITSSLTKEYNYIQGHIIRHETIIEGQTVSTYTIDGGAETPEDTSKTYTTVRAAIEAAASQPVDVPSSNLYYIKARAKNIIYHRK